MFQLQSTHLIRFQSTSSSAPVPVYFIQRPAPCGAFSSLPACDAASPRLAHFHGPLFYKDSSSLGFLFCKDSWDFSSVRTHFHSLLIYLNGCYFLLLWNILCFCVCVYFNCIFCSNISLKYCYQFLRNC